MSSNTAVLDGSKPELVQARVSTLKKPYEEEKGVDHVEHSGENLVYDDNDKEPELHSRTYLTLVAMFLLSFVQVVALQGPPAVVCVILSFFFGLIKLTYLFQLSYIGKDLNNTPQQTWIPNSLALVQAVIAPVISSASDTFQARKTILVTGSTISFIGAAIAPGSESIYRLIVAQILIGFGFATTPLAYCVPSEILPRKWRPSKSTHKGVLAFEARKTDLSDA